MNSAVGPRFTSELVVQEYDGSNNDEWLVYRPLRYVTYHLGYPWEITVPRDFISDLASIPHFLRPIIRRRKTHKGGVLHDYLTRRNPYHDDKGKDGLTRRDCDKIFRESLKTCGVSSAKCTVMYHAVRLYSLTKRS